MPSQLDAIDRKLLLGAALIAVLLISATLLFAPPPPREKSPVPSTYSSGPAGARAAYLLLLDLNYPVRRWEEPPARLAGLGPASILILAEPNEMPSNAERKWLLQFVRQGGRILFCGHSIPSFFPGANLSAQISNPAWKDFSPIAPSYLSRNVKRIALQPQALWSRPNASQIPLFGDPRAPAVIAWRIGAGELIWWAAASPLTNTGILRADNLDLFLNVVSFISAGAPRAIYWDEYFHGLRGSLWTYIARTPLVWGLVQLVLITCIMLFTLTRRWGPIAMPAARSRLSPLEFVDTLGGLYERARASSVAVDVAYRHLRTALTQQLALPPSVSHAALAQAAGERLDWNTAELTQTLDTAAAASRNSRLRPGAALAIVQRLHEFAARLNVRKPGPLDHN